MVLYLRGNIHPGDNIFGETTRGRQCSFMSLSALLASHIWQVHTWTQLLLTVFCYMEINLAQMFLYMGMYLIQVHFLFQICHLWPKPLMVFIHIQRTTNLISKDTYFIQTMQPCISNSTWLHNRNFQNQFLFFV